jgi:ADP-heptose:LPS heptosyltransferase
MIRAVRRRRYDVTIEMIDDDSSTGLLLSQFCSGAAVRIGANKSRYTVYYDLTTDYHSHPHVHAIDRALDLGALLGLERGGLSGFAAPYLPAGARERAARFLAEHAIGMRPVIAVNVSAGKATRLWADEKYASLLAGVARFMPEAALVLISDPADRNRGERIIALAEPQVIHVPEGWTILDVTALLARATTVISPDTSVVHLARAFAVPVVGLYPRPQWMVNRWKPYGQKIGIVRSDDDGDIADITPEAVMAAFRDLTRQEKVTDR